MEIQSIIFWTARTALPSAKSLENFFLFLWQMYASFQTWKYINALAYSGIIYTSSLELSRHIIINHTEQLGFSNTILIGHLRKTLFCLKCTNRVLIYVIEILGTNLNTFFKLSKFKNLYLRHCFKCFSFFFCLREICKDGL